MENQTPKTKKPIWKRWWFWVGGIIVLFIIIGSSGGNNNPQSQPTAQEKPIEQVVVQNTTKQEPTPVQQAEPAPTQPTPPPAVSSLEEQIKNQVKDIRATKFSFIGLEIEKADPDRPVGTKMVTAKVLIGDFLDRDSLLRGTGELSSNLFQTIYKSNVSTSDAFVWYYGNTKDKYGNEKQDVILTYGLNQTTYNKINWSNFDQYKLCDFLKQEAVREGFIGGDNCVELVNIK